MPITATDPFSSYGKLALNSPATRAASITPSDTDELTYVTRAIFVGGAGTLKVTTSGGDVVTYTGLVAGTTKAIRVKKVWATGTSATNLMAEW